MNDLPARTKILYFFFSKCNALHYQSVKISKRYYEFRFSIYVCIKLFPKNFLKLPTSWKLLFQLAINFVSKNWIKFILRNPFLFSIGIENL